MPDACPCLWLEASFSILHLLAASAARSLLWESVEQSRDCKALTWSPSWHIRDGKRCLGCQASIIAPTPGHCLL